MPPAGVAECYRGPRTSTTSSASSPRSSSCFQARTESRRALNWFGPSKSTHVGTEWLKSGGLDAGGHQPEGRPLVRVQAHEGGRRLNQYEVTEGWDWYETHGDTDDWSYGCRGDMDWTIEVANPGASGIPGVFAKNRDAIVYFIEQAGRGVSGVVTDATTGEPLEALVEPMPVGWPAFTDAQGGDFHRVLRPGTYSLRVWAPGHEAKTVENVVVPAGGAVRVDVALAPIAGEYHALNVTTAVIPNDDDYHNKTHAPHALGPADGRFVSLANGGHVVLDLGAAFPTGSGAAITMHDAAPDSDIPESAEVSTFASIDGPWTPLATVIGSDTFSATSVQRYLKVQDKPARIPSEGDPPTTPGYDLDAVDVVVPVVPPAP